MDIAFPGGTPVTNTVALSTDLPGDNPANNQSEWVTTLLSACGEPATLIHVIQGNGLTSPELGNIHFVEGIVVGDWQGTTDELSGFYIQEEDADADADATTSEGIFIYDNGYGVDVNEGDLVRVSGTVNEFGDLTQLDTITELQVCSSGNSVTVTSITLPVATVDTWEQYEGMLVQVEGTLYVTEDFLLGRYGQVPVSINSRLWNPTQVITPGIDANNLEDLNDRSRIALDDANPNQNADPTLYPTGGLSATNTLRGGDTIPNVVGVIDHFTNDSSNDYRLHPTQPVDFTPANPRPATPDPVGGSLLVGSFNVLNYFTTLDDGVNDICGPNLNLECRGADSALEFDRQNAKIVNALLTMDADIVGLIEIENHITDDAINFLVNELNIAPRGGGTYAAINTGPIGEDAIRVAIIYKPASVTPVGAHAILDQSVDPTYLDSKNRPALAQTFMENSSGEIFTVVVNHLKSKGSACDDVGDPNQNDGQGNCNGVRTAAALAEVNWLATDPTGSGDPDFLVLGDLNSYAMEDPIAQFLNAGYVDEQRDQDGFESYTYVFDGEWGALDYALTSPNLHTQLTGVTAWHTNSDEPIVLDYNTEFKSPGHIITLYDESPFRASDHDAVLVGLNLAPLPTDLTFTKDVATVEPVSPGDTVTYTLTLANAGPGDANGVIVEDILPAGVTGMDVNEVVTVTAGMTWTLSFEVVVDAGTWGQTITNTATADDGVVSDGFVILADSAAFDVRTEPLPNLAITKDVEPMGMVQVNDTVTFTIVVANSGDGDAMMVSVVDMLPASLNGVNISDTVDIMAGDSVTYTVPAIVTLDGAGQTITNTATLTFGTVQLSDSATITVDDRPTDISLSGFGEMPASSSSTILYLMLILLVATTGLILFKRKTAPSKL
jgi:uncharacterized repeat protein (TIGR01451 family)